MATLKQEILFYNDSVGRIRPNASISTYEAGATTTPKQTITDKSLKFKNHWPVVSDGAGVFPPIWLESGGYRIVWKDEDNVLFADRDDINVAETTILSTSDFYFEDLTAAKLGASINGSTIDLQVGQVARTVGKVTSTDGEGAEWSVVAGGTGTADDDLFVDLDNGQQLQKLFNQLYTARSLADLPDVAVARTNLDVYSKSESFVSDDLISLWTGSATSFDLSTLVGDYPGDGFYIITGPTANVNILLYIIDGLQVSTAGNFTFGGGQITGYSAFCSGSNVVSMNEMKFTSNTANNVNIIEIKKVGSQIIL